VNELIKPSDEALELVHEWLMANGVEKMAHSPAKDWVHVYIDVESAERLLDTEYYLNTKMEVGLHEHHHGHCLSIFTST